MFNEDFLKKLPNEPYKAVKVMCETFFTKEAQIIPGTETDHFKDYIEAFAAIEAYITATGLPFPIPELDKEEPLQNIKLINSFFGNANEKAREELNKLTIDKAREKYATLFGTTFIYQFSDGDLAQIQKLINELREIITKSELFDAKHKERILKKLEMLQTELHKKMSNLDKLWGLLGEAGVALGKFGKDAKPLVDRIREISQITWRTQARAEELPSGTTLPLLTDSKQEDK